MSDTTNDQEVTITLETATNWARSNREWDKVYRYLFLHPKDFFVILPGRRWPIAHQVVYHGDVDLLKRILALADDEIDIRTKSVDNKTLLDVAKEKQNGHPAMYTYVEHLFDQDQLIRDAKQQTWRSVVDSLVKNKELANEKPPYSPYFLLHCVIEYGDADTLQDLLNRFQFLTNVLNTKNESPLDMATRLNKQDICAILRPITVPRSSGMPKQPLTEASPSTVVSEHEKHQTSTPKHMNLMTKSNLIGFESVTLDINQSGEFTVGQNTLYNSAYGPLPPLPPPPPVQPSRHKPPTQSPASASASTVQPKPSEFKHVVTRRTIIRECPLSDPDPSDPPEPPPSTSALTPTEQLLRNFICPITKKIFVDPVIASDGQTYERSAILQWIEQKHTSPTTGAPMTANVRDNKDIKEIIHSIQGQK